MQGEWTINTNGIIVVAITLILMSNIVSYHAGKAKGYIMGRKGLPWK